MHVCQNDFHEKIKVTTCPGHHKSLLQKVIMVHDHASLAATSSHAESTPEKSPPVRMSTLPRLFEPFVFSHGGFSSNLRTTRFTMQVLSLATGPLKAWAPVPQCHSTLQRERWWSSGLSTLERWRKAWWTWQRGDVWREWRVDGIVILCDFSACLHVAGGYGWQLEGKFADSRQRLLIASDAM